MRVVRLNSFEQVHDYDVHWNDLVGICRDNHIFLTLEWLETWWKHFGADRELLLLAVVNNRRILALAPLMNTTYRLFGARLRNIEFIGTPASDYQSFILISDKLKCTRMILKYVERQLWDCIELKNIPEWSETARRLKASSGKPLALKEREMDKCSFVPLPSTFEEYLQKLRGRKRKDLRRCERRIREKHRLEYGSFGQMSFRLEEAMEIFFMLHQQRWESLGYAGKFTDPVFRDFHMNLARRFHKRGWLRLFFVTLDSEPVAADYLFEYGRKLYNYLMGFNPKYSSYGVGSICTLRSIESGIKSGLREYDMLRGKHSYKESWASMTRKNIELSAVRWKPISKAYEWFVRSEILPSLSSRLREHAFSNKVHARAPN